jgi:ribonuclease HII
MIFDVATKSANNRSANATDRRRFRKLVAFDSNHLRDSGLQSAREIAGCDEAGRGAWAGPLVVAGVAWSPDLVRGPRAAQLSRINDSKMLDGAVRDDLVGGIVRNATRLSVSVLSARTIDRSGLHASNLSAMGSVAERIRVNPRLVLTDGFVAATPAGDTTRLVRADRSSAVVAAASIVAKSVRDRAMARLDRMTGQGWGFADHKGYGTSEHGNVLRSLGPSTHHRHSFRPVGDSAVLRGVVVP